MITQYNVIQNGKNVSVNRSNLQCEFVLIHNNVKVINLNEVKHKNGILETINTIFEAATKEECLNEIKRLKLIVDNEDLAADLKSLEQPSVKQETNLKTPSVISEPVPFLKLLNTKQ